MTGGPPVHSGGDSVHVLCFISKDWYPITLVAEDTKRGGAFFRKVGLGAHPWPGDNDDDEVVDNDDDVGVMTERVSVCCLKYVCSYNTCIYCLVTEEKTAKQRKWKG